MIRLKDAWWRETDKAIRSLLYETVYVPILELIDDPRAVLNSRQAVIDALRRGQISYDDGEFSGRFTAAISRELSRFAAFDSRSKTWRGEPPPDILGAAIAARTRAEDLSRRIESRLDRLPERLDAALRDMAFPTPSDMIDRELSDDIKSLGIQPTITSNIRERLEAEYGGNLDRDIKNWAPEQIERLRDMVERHSMKGFRRDELMQMIAHEWEVSTNKAAFLARNEASLFASALRDARYQEAGIRRYRWSATGGASGDGRTRRLHRKLHGKEFSYSSPPIIDERTGKRGNPGEIWNCRCSMVPLL